MPSGQIVVRYIPLPGGDGGYRKSSAESHDSKFYPTRIPWPNPGMINLNL